MAYYLRCPDCNKRTTSICRRSSGKLCGKCITARRLKISRELARKARLAKFNEINDSGSSSFIGVCGVHIATCSCGEKHIMKHATPMTVCPTCELKWSRISGEEIIKRSSSGKSLSILNMINRDMLRREFKAGKKCLISGDDGINGMFSMPYKDARNGATVIAGKMLQARFGIKKKNVQRYLIVSECLSYFVKNKIVDRKVVGVDVIMHAVIMIMSGIVEFAFFNQFEIEMSEKYMDKETKRIATTYARSCIKAGLYRGIEPLFERYINELDV